MLLSLAAEISPGEDISALTDAGTVSFGAGVTVGSCSKALRLFSAGSGFGGAIVTVGSCSKALRLFSAGSGVGGAVVTVGSGSKALWLFSTGSGFGGAVVIVGSFVLFTFVFISFICSVFFASTPLECKLSVSSATYFCQGSPREGCGGTVVILESDSQLTKFTQSMHIRQKRLFNDFCIFCLFTIKFFNDICFGCLLKVLKFPNNLPQVK
jgi:hypothetical protein